MQQKYFKFAIRFQHWFFITKYFNTLMINCQAILKKMNKLGKEKVPFLFVFDFLCKAPLIFRLDELNSDELLFSINGITNIKQTPDSKKHLSFDVKPYEKTKYVEAFNFVQKHIKHGDSFLLNLTFPSKIESNFSLKDIFFASKAKYKLWIKDRFVVFSPEIFVQTKDNIISSFPMKGTIDASVPNAKQKLLNSEKELAEHFTIVDLIRNDLSMVAKNVKVESFRNIEKIVTNKGEILQMSSKISGELANNFSEQIGNIITKMLPAGSISGAPKKKTLEIIEKAENYNRDYYTGIFGIFDGENIDSGVMIRFVEQHGKKLIYKSGGGITAQSNANEEYDELIKKVYVPI